MSRPSVRSSRQSLASRSVRSRDDAIESSPVPDVFELQPQETPLNADAIFALQKLEKGDGSLPSRYLMSGFDRAATYCRESVEKANEQAYLEKTRYQNRLEHQKENGNEANIDKDQYYQELQAKVDTLNQKVEKAMRQLIADKNFSANGVRSVQHVLTKTADAQNRRTRIREENDTGEAESDAATELPQLDVAEHATTLLQAAQSTFESSWNSKSLTDKYTVDPLYSDFYKLRWDVQHQEQNPPPMPRPAMWFAAEEGRRQPANQSSQRPTRDSGSEDSSDEEMRDLEEDSDIEVHAENISCKCPLTLVWFENPVSSTKCNHSFEKSAIMDILRQSKDRLPLTEEQSAAFNESHPRGSRGRLQAEAQIQSKNPFFVLCPVCSAQLTAANLREDPVLLRRTRRAKEAQDQSGIRDLADDSDDSGDDFLRKTQRGNGPKKEVVNINSSPAASRRQTAIKNDSRAIPNQPSPLGARGSSRARQVQTIADDDDEDEMSE